MPNSSLSFSERGRVFEELGVRLSSSWISSLLEEENGGSVKVGESGFSSDSLLPLIIIIRSARCFSSLKNARGEMISRLVSSSGKVSDSARHNNLSVIQKYGIITVPIF